MKFYYCKVCGKVISVLNEKEVPTVCCNEKMEESVANTVDAAKEKHLPVVKVENTTLHISVGEVLHPMDREHFISFVLVKTNQNQILHTFKPEDEPTCEIALLKGEKVEEVFAYCNKHGLWAFKN